MAFFDALFQYAFLQHAMIAGLLASVACGTIGTLVDARRITYIAAGIAHSVLGGMGAAQYLRTVQGLDWLRPLHGAIVAALLAAAIIAYVSVRAREREDTVISALWSIGMAAGIIFLAYTPGYNQNLMSFLIGNVLAVSQTDLLLLAALDAVLIVLVYAFYHQLVATCLDQEFARVRGVQVDMFFHLLLGLIAVTVVLLVSVVGIILVIALLTIPVAIAAVFTYRLIRRMVAASLISALLVTLGLALSFKPDLPSGATIILVAGAAYALVILSRLRQRSTSQ